jgi:hypothetical protein
MAQNHHNNKKQEGITQRAISLSLSSHPCCFGEVQLA